MDMSNSGIDYSADRVQSSPKDPMFESACRMMEQMRAIDCEIAELTEKINCAIDLIRKVTRERPAETLFKRYYEGIKLNRIAEDMGYSYAQVKRFHEQGLRELSAIMPPSVKNR